MLCFYFLLLSKISPYGIQKIESIVGKFGYISVFRTVKLSKIGRLFETAIFNIVATGKQPATFQRGWGPRLYLGRAGWGAGRGPWARPMRAPQDTGARGAGAALLFCFFPVPS